MSSKSPRQSARALVELARDGSRREWTFGELVERRRAPGRRAATRSASARGDVVLTLVGNRPEWALTMLACFRQGYVVLPCTEQLRPKDLAQRLRRRAAAARRRRRAQRGDAARGRLERRHALGPVRGGRISHSPPPAELAPEDPCLITFTSGTAGEPKAVLHGQRYLTGQQLQAEHWLAPAARPSSCGAPPPRAGRSRPATRSSRPGCRGAAALLHDARFDPAERLELIARERVDVLCMAPTEYRVIAKRATLQPLPSLQRRRRRRRGAQPRGPARLARGGRALDPRRLRPDRDRPAHRRAARRDAAARLDGQAAAGRAARHRRRRARARPARPTRRSSCATSATSRTPVPGTPATASRATTTATCTSRAAPTT